MISYRDYYQILEELRIDQSLTVGDLCEGIMSERTYYRHLKSDHSIRLDTFIKLADRLGFSTEQLVSYSIFFRKDDPGIVKFVYRVHISRFADIEKYYQKAAIFSSGNRLYDLLVEAYVRKYEFLIHKISQEEYASALEEIMHTIQSEPIMNIYILSIRVLYAEIKPENTFFELMDLAKDLLQNDFRMSALFSLNALDSFIYRMTGTKFLQEETYTALVNRLAEIVQMHVMRFFRMRCVFYDAYLFFMKKNVEKAHEFVLKYLMSLVVLQTGEAFRNARDKVEGLFDIQIQSFVKSQALQTFHSNRFVIRG